MSALNLKKHIDLDFAFSSWQEMLTLESSLNARSSVNTSKQKITNIYKNERSFFETIGFKNALIHKHCIFNFCVGAIGPTLYKYQTALLSTAVAFIL